MGTVNRGAICPICHEEKQHITYKYCDRCRKRVTQIIRTRDTFGEHRHIDYAIQTVRQELGIVVVIQSKPIPVKPPEACPCPEYGNRTGGTCMFPMRKDGSCAKLKGFKRKTESVWY